MTMSAGQVTPPREARAIRATLAEHDAAERDEFDRQFREALVAASEDFDLARLDAVLNRWWPAAYMHAHPATDEERATVARARSGEVTGLWEQTSTGGWSRH